jgi:hypothetical protein
VVCVIFCTIVSLLVAVSLLWLAATGLRAQAERVDGQVRLAQRQLFDLTTRAYRRMLDEARRQDRP